ncbi:AAA family ATPase, partial [Salmonella enterica]|uniref:AAA family ATPase n=1 Tax=Salmonella enterica TaxID=28901 RepID=UPI0020C4A024
HLLGKNKPLRRIIESGIIPNLILYGPSGTGKTSFANVVANISKKKFVKLNGTTATIKDIQNVVSKLDMLEGCNGIILFM